MHSQSMYLSPMNSIRQSAKQNDHEISSHILSLADRCVKCGLCLPQCPTYALSNNENESPRGRIALIQGWLGGQLAPTEKLISHIDQCLLCRRCERICPSVVPYGEIIDQAKALLKQRQTVASPLKKRLRTTSLKLLINQYFSRPLIFSLRLLQKSGGLLLLQKSQLLKLVGLQPFVESLPELDKPFKPKKFYPTLSNKQGEVALFTGCLSNAFDAKTVQSSIYLLTLLGYDVHVPAQQGCCGALHLHDGEQQQAADYAAHNIHTFNQLKNVSTIISIVNGCTAQLKEYPQLTANESFTPEIKDIVEFLSEISWPEDIELKAFEKSVALQIPCSLQNSLRAGDKLVSLLQRIPGLKLNPDTIYNRCCGAAGSYFVHFPEISNNLKQQALTTLTKTGAELIISSNLGCALQLKSGLTTNNNSTAVIHPVTLLAQQLKS